MSDKVALRIRVQIDNGRFVMIPVRTGVPPRAQAQAAQHEYDLPDAAVDDLAARIQAALEDDPQPAQSNARRLLRDGVDAAQDVAELSYREFPLRLDDTDDDSGSDGNGDTARDDGWEPRRPTGPAVVRNTANDLVVHVMINDHDEAVLNVRRGSVAITAVDEFVARHGLSPAKRQLLVDHVLAHLPPEPAVPNTDAVVAVITVMVQDRFLDRLEIRAHDDFVQMLQEISDRNQFAAAQQRRLTASAFVNMERVELSQDRDRCPAAFLIRLDAGGDAELDDVLCDDDLMAMLNADRVVAFCDRRQISTGPVQRQALVQAIASSRQPSSAPAVTDEIVTEANSIPDPCLTLRIYDNIFQLFDDDDVLDRINSFADQHRVSDSLRLDLVRVVLRALSRAEAPNLSLDADAVTQFADRHHLSADRQSRTRLMLEVSRSLAIFDQSSAGQQRPMPDKMHHPNKTHRRARTSQSQVFHRLYAEHLIRKRKSISSEPRHERKPSSARSVVCDRLYSEGLKFLHRRRASSATAELDDEELTFRPQINTEMRRGHRHQFFSGRSSSRTQQRQLQYLTDRKQQEISACTFRPDVRTDFQPNPGPVHERLYRDGQARSQRQSALQAVSEELRKQQQHGSDPERLDRLHNHNLYKQQAIESFRRQFHEFDADGYRLFHIRDYMTNSTPRMESSRVADYLHTTATQASRPSAASSPAVPPNPTLARSNALVCKAIQSRLRRLYSSLMHDGVIDGLSALRLKSDQSQIAANLRALVQNVVVDGTSQGKTLNFDQFSKQILQSCQARGVLPSEFIQTTQKQEKAGEPVPKKQVRNSRSERDVCASLYQEARTLKDRRFVLQYKALALESARDSFPERGESQKSCSQTAR